MPNHLKVYGYCRKSSESEDRQVLSIDSQKQELIKIAAARGLEVIDYLEESKSAKAPGRPVFSLLLEKIHKGEAGGILCWKLDRLARNPVDGGAVIWAVKEKGIEIITPSQTYSHQSENTLLMYVEFGMAQKFIDDLGKNVKRGMNTKAEQGWYPQHAPLGYKNTPDLQKGYKVIVKDEARFPLIQRVFQEILKGRQAMQVFKEARDEWGLTGRSGKPIAQSTFYHILNTPFYAGEYEWPKDSSHWINGGHEPVITRDEFDIIQRMLGKFGKPIARNHVHNLTGLIKCGSCGYGITATKKTKHYATTNRTVNYTYYHCSQKKKGKCHDLELSEAKLNKQIEETLFSIRPDEEFIRWAKKWLSVVHEEESKHNEITLSTQQDKLHETECKLNRLLDLRINEEVDEATYKTKKIQLEQDKRRIQERLKDTDLNLNSWRKNVETTLDFAYAALDKFRTGTRDDKQQIILTIGSNFTLKDGKIRIDLYDHFKVLAEQENWEEKYKDWVEPQNYTELKAKYPDCVPLNPIWLPE